MAAGNTNPQGIADPPVSGMLLLAAPTLIAANLPAGTSLDPVVASSVPAVATPPAGTGQDALFVTLGGERLQRASEPSFQLIPSGILAILVGDRMPSADR